MVRLHKKNKGKDQAESAEEAVSIEKIQKYLKEKQVPELFNRLLTQIIHDKPADVKKHLCEQLTLIKNLEKEKNLQEIKYFTSEDFDTMFDSYDLAGENSVNYYCLLQALRVAGVKDPETALKEDFSMIKEDDSISRTQFSQVMLLEFGKRGYSN